MTIWTREYLFFLKKNKFLNEKKILHERNIFFNIKKILRKGRRKQEYSVNYTF